MRLRLEHKTWLAALIDGEGTVMLVRHTTARSNTKNHTRRMGYRPRVEISNTHRGILQAVVDRTGIDRIGVRTLPDLPNRKSICYVWRANITELRWLLPQITPHLIIKKRQAELLLAAMKLKDEIAPVPGEKWEFHDVDKRRPHQEKIEAIVTEISNLNRKGRRAL